MVDPSIVGPLSLIAEASELREQGVDDISILQFDRSIADSLNTALFLIRPTCVDAAAADDTDAIIDDRLVVLTERYGVIDMVDSNECVSMVREYVRRRPTMQTVVACVPRKTLMCSMALESISASISILEYGLDIMPIAKDVLSFEIPDSFRECALVRRTNQRTNERMSGSMIFMYDERDREYRCNVSQQEYRPSLFFIARALLKLQSVYGVVPLIQGKGRASKVRETSQQSIASTLIRVNECRCDEFGIQLTMTMMTMMMMISRW